MTAFVDDGAVGWGGASDAECFVVQPSADESRTANPSAKWHRGMMRILEPSKKTVCGEVTSFRDSPLYSRRRRCEVGRHRETIQIALQEYRSCHLVNFLLPILTSDVPFDEQAIGLFGGQSFVPRLDRDCDCFAEDRYELTNPGRGFPIAAVHIAWHANQNKFHFPFLQQCLKPR